MAKNFNYFDSSIGEGFWKMPEIKDRERIASVISRDCTRSVGFGIFLTLIFLLGLAAGVHDYLTADNPDPQWVLIAILSPIFTVLFVSSIFSNMRYVSKAKAYAFRSHHVLITDKHTQTVNGRIFYYVVLEGVDEDGVFATCEVMKGLYDIMQVGVKGLFVRVDDEPKRLMLDPFWFLPEEISDNSFEGTADGGVVSASFKKRVTPVYIRLAVCTVLEIAGILMTVTGFFLLKVSGLLIILLVMCFIGRRTIKEAFMGGFGNMIAFTILVFGTIAGSVPALDKGAASPINALVLTGVLILHMAVLLFCEKDTLATWNKIKKGDYSSAKATLISKNVAIVSQGSLLPGRRFSCVAKLSSGDTSEAVITPKQHKELAEGDQGYLVVVGKKKFFLT